MRRDLLTIMHLGLAFLLIFSAFNSQGFIEISVLRTLSANPESGIGNSAGYTSLGIIYMTLTISNLFSPLVILKIGSKFSMVIGCMCYSAFLFSFLKLSAFTLYVASALLGIGAGILWTGNGSFLVEFSREGKLSRNCAVHWTMLQSSLLVGSAFLWVVLHEGSIVEHYEFAYIGFGVLSIIGLLLLLALPSSPSTVSSTIEDDEEPLTMEDEEYSRQVRGISSNNNQTSLWDEFVRTFTLIRRTEFQFLILTFIYSGLETSFLTGIYTSCLSAFDSLSKPHPAIVAYAVFLMGVGQITAGITWSQMCKSGRGNSSASTGFVVFGCCMHLVAFFLCFLNVPSFTTIGKTSDAAFINPNFTVALIVSVLLGMSDCALHTQLYALLGVISEPTEAVYGFAIFKFIQSLTMCAVFLIGSHFEFQYHLLVQSVFAALGTIGFIKSYSMVPRERLL